jgi:hypothetical protein
VLGVVAVAALEALVQLPLLMLRILVWEVLVIAPLLVMLHQLLHFLMVRLPVRMFLEQHI